MRPPSRAGEAGREADANSRAASRRSCTRLRRRLLAGEPRGCTRLRKKPLAGEPRRSASNSELYKKSIKIGRILCDRVAAMMNNQGFFTTDERPEYGIRYGISQHEYHVIFQQISANPHEDLIVLFAYALQEAEQTKQVFEQLLYEAQRESLLNIVNHKHSDKRRSQDE